MHYVLAGWPLSKKNQEQFKNISTTFCHFLRTQLRELKKKYQLFDDSHYFPVWLNINRKTNA